jgi:hypothetical protein
MAREHIHFVTGKLAAPALEQVLRELAPRAGFDYSIETLGISVAALMTPRWIAARLHVPDQATRVMLPGYCGGDLGPVAEAAGLPVENGPKDLRRLPEHFGNRPRPTTSRSWPSSTMPRGDPLPQSWARPKSWRSTGPTSSI